MLANCTQLSTTSETLSDVDGPINQDLFTAVLMVSEMMVVSTQPTALRSVFHMTLMICGVDPLLFEAANHIDDVDGQGAGLDVVQGGGGDLVQGGGGDVVQGGGVDVVHGGGGDVDQGGGGDSKRGPRLDPSRQR